MKIISIAKSIIIRNLRDVKIMLIMCAMPLVLIFVLGMSFDNQIGSNMQIPTNDMTISYSIIGQESGLTTGLKDVIKEFTDETSTFNKVSDKDSELKKIADDEITCFIEIDENKKAITLYKNNVNNIKASLIENALNIYVDRYNTILEIVKINYKSLPEILEENDRQSFVQNIGIDEKNMPSAMDYYGVLMVMLFVLYGALSPLEGIVEDRQSGNLARVHTTSVKKMEFFFGTLIGYVMTTCIRIFIVVVISYLAFDINWGTNSVFAFLLIFALIVAVTSVVIALTNIIKSAKASMAVMHIFIVLSGFFGGSYLALEDMGSIGQVGKYISVIWWGNVGIMNQIYNNDYNYMIKTFILCGIVTLLSLAFSVVYMNKKKEQLYV